QPVTLGRDFGATIDIQAGLQGTETIVTQPRVSMQEGQIVKPRAAAAANDRDKKSAADNQGGKAK
ncbi:MAG TPA: hypothetical protein VGI70_06250, partial [Polyangiales bacterium]